MHCVSNFLTRNFPFQGEAEENKEICDYEADA